MVDPLTSATVGAGWKLIAKLWDKYDAWSERRKTSKAAKALQDRANELMVQINKAILSGASSTDAQVKPLVAEFLKLVKTDGGIDGSGFTKGLIAKSGGFSAHRRAVAIASDVNKVAAKKSAAKKAVAKKPAAKKAAEKRPAAK